jgi:hypothetical protein
VRTINSQEDNRSKKKERETERAKVRTINSQEDSRSKKKRDTKHSVLTSAA